MKPLVQRILPLLASGVLAISLSSCGGGSAGAPVSAPPAPVIGSGYFIDSAVKGLNFTSGTQTGVTDALGHFTYEVGQPVLFKMGNITIGRTLPTSNSTIITPFDLTTIAGIPYTPPEWSNVAVFLQSLDEDAMPNNGIQFTPAVITAAAGLAATDIATSANIAGVVALLDATAITTATAVANAHLKAQATSLFFGSYTSVVGTDTVNLTANFAGGQISGTVISQGGFVTAVFGTVSHLGVVFLENLAKTISISGSISREGLVMSATLTNNTTATATNIAFTTPRIPPIINTGIYSGRYKTVSTSPLTGTVTAIGIISMIIDAAGNVSGSAGTYALSGTSTATTFSADATDLTTNSVIFSITGKFNRLGSISGTIQSTLSLITVTGDIQGQRIL